MRWSHTSAMSLEMTCCILVFHKETYVHCYHAVSLYTNFNKLISTQKLHVFDICSLIDLLNNSLFWWASGTSVNFPPILYTSFTHKGIEEVTRLVIFICHSRWVEWLHYTYQESWYSLYTELLTSILYIRRYLNSIAFV